MSEHADWSLTLTRHEPNGTCRARISLYDNDLGEMVGEALHFGIRVEGEDGNGPIEKLCDVIHMLTVNYVTFQSDELHLLNQLLLQRMADDGCGKEVLLKVMAKLSKGTP